jgi:hypothetical protein
MTTNEFESLFQPDDEPGGHRGAHRERSEAGQLPELPAPSSGNLENEPAQAPIDLGDLDVELAKLLLRAPIRLAASVMSGISERDAVELVEATVDRVILRALGGFEEGISVSELAEKARIGQGRIGERFDASLPPFANLVVRAIHAQAKQRVFYEELSSHPARVGRRHNGVGTDKLPGLPKSLHLLATSLGVSDRHCPAISEVLTMGTRWDGTSLRFGAPLPNWATEDRLDEIPGPFAEHLEQMLRIDHATRTEFVAAVKEGRAIFDSGITPSRMAATFSPFLVVPPISYGPPEVMYRDRGGAFLPGRNSDTVEVAVASGRYVVLACGEPTHSERLEFEEGCEALTVGRLPSMYELDIHKVHGVEYRWSPTRHELGRYEAGRGGRLQIWRFVRCADEKHFWQMVSLIERQAQVTWTQRCTERWERDCLPGLQKAHLPESCAGVRALLVMANAGIVDALRREGRPSEFD